MTQLTVDTMPPLKTAIAVLMHRDGPLRVFVASFLGLFRDAAVRREIEFLPDEVRQDIGLPPKPRPVSLTERLR